MIIAIAALRVCPLTAAAKEVVNFGFQRVLEHLAGSLAHETLFGQLALTNAGRQGDMVQALVPARPWYWLLRGFWAITALVDADDRVVSFRVQGHSGL